MKRTYTSIASSPYRKACNRLCETEPGKVADVAVAALLGQAWATLPRTQHLSEFRRLLRSHTVRLIEDTARRGHVWALLDEAINGETTREHATYVRGLMTEKAFPTITYNRNEKDDATWNTGFVFPRDRRILSFIQDNEVPQQERNAMTAHIPIKSSATQVWYSRSDPADWRSALVALLVEFFTGRKEANVYILGTFFSTPENLGVPMVLQMAIELYDLLLYVGSGSARHSAYRILSRLPGDVLRELIMAKSTEIDELLREEEARPLYDGAGTELLRLTREYYNAVVEWLDRPFISPTLQEINKKIDTASKSLTWAYQQAALAFMLQTEALTRLDPAWSPSAGILDFEITMGERQIALWLARLDAFALMQNGKLPLSKDSARREGLTLVVTESYAITDWLEDSAALFGVRSKNRLDIEVYSPSTNDATPTFELLMDNKLLGTDGPKCDVLIVESGVLERISTKLLDGSVAIRRVVLDQSERNFALRDRRVYKIMKAFFEKNKHVSRWILSNHFDYWGEPGRKAQQDLIIFDPNEGSELQTFRARYGIDTRTVDGRRINTTIAVDLEYAGERDAYQLLRAHALELYLQFLGIEDTPDNHLKYGALVHKALRRVLKCLVARSALSLEVELRILEEQRALQVLKSISINDDSILPRASFWKRTLSRIVSVPTPGLEDDVSKEQLNLTEERAARLKAWPSSRFTRALKEIGRIAESDADARFVVFSSFTSVLKLFETAMRTHPETSHLGSAVLPGLDSDHAIQEALRNFTGDKKLVRVLGLDYSFAYSNFDLTAAKYILLLDNSVDDVDESRAISLTYRPDVTHDVYVYNFVTNGTHDDKIGAARAHFKKHLNEIAVRGLRGTASLSKIDDTLALATILLEA